MKMNYVVLPGFMPLYILTADHVLHIVNDECIF